MKNQENQFNITQLLEMEKKSTIYREAFLAVQRKEEYEKLSYGTIVQTLSTLGVDIKEAHRIFSESIEALKKYREDSAAYLIEQAKQQKKIDYLLYKSIVDNVGIDLTGALLELLKDGMLERNKAFLENGIEEEKQFLQKFLQIKEKFQALNKTHTLAFNDFFVNGEATDVPDGELDDVYSDFAVKFSDAINTVIEKQSDDSSEFESVCLGLMYYGK